MKWISVNEKMPTEGVDVWVAGEMAYNNDKEPFYFTGVGWLRDENSFNQQCKTHPYVPKDVNRWYTINDWWEGQDYYKITHWKEMSAPIHPIHIKKHEQLKGFV